MNDTNKKRNIEILHNVIAIIVYSLMLLKYGPELYSSHPIRTIITFTVIILSLFAYLRVQPKKTKPFNKIFEVAYRKFKKACIWGGMIAGLIGSLVISILFLIHNPQIGYENIDDKHFVSVIIFVYFFQISLGYLLGWFCAKVSWNKTNHSGKFKRFCNKTLIFLFAFCSIVFFRQLMSRDALVKPGFYAEKTDSLDFLGGKCVDSEFKNSFIWNAPEKKYIRMGGGYFGEPDFETLATGLMGGITFLFLVTFLSNIFIGNNIVKMHAPSSKGALWLISKAAFWGFVSWLFVYGIYSVLINNCIITKYDIIYRRWYFTFDFPHPERFLLTFGLCLVYLLSFLLFIRSNLITIQPSHSLVRKKK